MWTPTERDRAALTANDVSMLEYADRELPFEWISSERLFLGKLDTERAREIADGIGYAKYMREHCRE